MKKGLFSADAVLVAVVLQKKSLHSSKTTAANAILKLLSYSSMNTSMNSSMLVTRMK